MENVTLPRNKPPRYPHHLVQYDEPLSYIPRQIKLEIVYGPGILEEVPENHTFLQFLSYSRYDQCPS